MAPGPRRLSTGRVGARASPAPRVLLGRLRSGQTLRPPLPPAQGRPPAPPARRQCQRRTGDKSRIFLVLLGWQRGLPSAPRLLAALPPGCQGGRGPGHAGRDRGDRWTVVATDEAPGGWHPGPALLCRPRGLAGATAAVCTALLWSSSLSSCGARPSGALSGPRACLCPDPALVPDWQSCDQDIPAVRGLSPGHRVGDSSLSLNVWFCASEFQIPALPPRRLFVAESSSPECVPCSVSGPLVGPAPPPSALLGEAPGRCGAFWPGVDDAQRVSEGWEEGKERPGSPGLPVLAGIPPRGECPEPCPGPRQLSS
ncbi:hypothetical protein AB1E18_004621 [Capra hircus]